MSILGYRTVVLFVGGLLAAGLPLPAAAQDQQSDAEEVPADAEPDVPASVEPSAEEPSAPQVDNSVQPAVNVGAPPSRLRVRDRWENALDVKATNLYDRQASDFTSPTLMLNIEWNYKFITNTFIGGVLGGLPQPIKRTDDDGVRLSYSTYYYGARLAQGIFDIRPFRLVVGVNAARGSLYSRVIADGADVNARILSYNLIEPSAFLTFWIYQGIEFGLIGSVRNIRLINGEGRESLATNEDLSAASYGLTFRTQRF